MKPSRKNTEKTVGIPLRLDDDTHDKLRILSLIGKKPMNSIIHEALGLYQKPKTKILDNLKKSIAEARAELPVSREDMIRMAELGAKLDDREGLGPLKVFRGWKKMSLPYEEAKKFDSSHIDYFGDQSTVYSFFRYSIGGHRGHFRRLLQEYSKSPNPLIYVSATMRRGNETTPENIYIKSLYLVVSEANTYLNRSADVFQIPRKNEKLKDRAKQEVINVIKGRLIDEHYSEIGTTI